MVVGFPKSMALGKAVDKKLGNERKKTGRILHHAQKGVAVAEERGEVGAGAFGVAHNEEETVGNTIYEGWGTALKPSFEPIIVARKPFKGSLVDNVIKYGVGGINIDECRVGTEERTYKGAGGSEITVAKGAIGSGAGKDLEFTVNGRFPANTILTYNETDFNEVCGGFPQSKGASSQNNYSNGSIYRGQSLNTSSTKLVGRREWYNDNGSASRYFYCAKASKKDRDEGLEEFEEKTAGELTERKEGSAGITAYTGSRVPKKNIHPTVKPTSLMQYLVRLVTPKNGIILDPFMGSGSTGKAAMFENKDRQANYSFIGIEKEKEYCDIAIARIEWAKNYKESKKDDNQIHFEDLGGLI